MWFRFTVALASLGCLTQALEPQQNSQWTDVWAAMPQLTEYTNMPTGVYNATPKFFNTTIRQTIKLDVPASSLDSSNELFIRLRISNAFGTTQLNVTNVTIARPLNNKAGASAIVTDSVQTVTFDNGNNFGVEIPAASLGVSDPIAVSFPQDVLSYASTNGTTQAGSLLTVTMYLSGGQTGDPNTSHPGSRVTSFLSLGNQVAATNISSDASAQTQALNHWYFIATVEAWLPTTTSNVVIVGDSITDGRASTDNMNNRWPDVLYTRLQQNYSSDPLLSKLTISNQAAGGNRVLADGNGPSALSRIDRDVLAHSNVKYVVLFEGINDIGTAGSDEASQNQVYDALIAAYRNIIARVHAHNLPIFGTTITPFVNKNATLQVYTGPYLEQTRQRLNDFIRNSGAFDGVVDFDAAIRSPGNETILNPIYNSNDGLHPNVEGYMAMARAFPVELFSQFENGVSRFV